MSFDLDEQEHEIMGRMKEKDDGLKSPKLGGDRAKAEANNGRTIPPKKTGERTVKERLHELKNSCWKI